MNTIRMSNSLDPDQARLSAAIVTGTLRVNSSKACAYTHNSWTLYFCPFKNHFLFCIFRT